MFDRGSDQLEQTHGYRWDRRATLHPSATVVSGMVGLLLMLQSLSPTRSTAAPFSPIQSPPSKTPLGRAPPTPLQPATTIGPIRPPVKPASRLAPSTSGVVPPPPQKTAKTTMQARPPETLGPGASGASGEGGGQPTTNPPQNDQETTQET